MVAVNAKGGTEKKQREHFKNVRKDHSENNELVFTRNFDWRAETSLRYKNVDHSSRRSSQKNEIKLEENIHGYEKARRTKKKPTNIRMSGM